MSVGIVGTAYKDFVSGNAEAAPIAGYPTLVDMAWGPGTNAAITTTLTCAGATVESGYSDTFSVHSVPLGGLQGIEAGWEPDGKNIYLKDTQAAQGFWRITFPTAGTYTINLAGVGSVILMATAPPAAPTPPTTSGTLPTAKLIYQYPLGTIPTKLFELSFNGTYPAGGFDFPASLFGLESLLFADIQDTATQRFAATFVANVGKMKVYTSAGEASGTVTFTTRALIFGSAN